MLVIIDEIIIPAIESAILAFVRAVQTKTFWIIVALLAIVVFALHMVTGLTIREIFSIEQMSNLWGLMDSGAAESGNTLDGNAPDKYRGGATPYVQ